MKISTILIFCTILFKYSQLYIGETNNIISIAILIFISFNVLLTLKKVKLNNPKAFWFFGLASLFVMWIARDPNFILPFLVAISLQNEKIEDLFKKFFICSVILFLLTMLLSVVGVLEDKELYKLDSNGNLVERQEFGFTGPNTMYLFTFGILISYYLMKGKITFLKKIGIFVVLTVFYQLTLSRTGYLVSILFLFTYPLVEKWSKAKIVQFLMRNSFVIFTILSIGIAYLFGTNYNQVVALLSGRPIFWLQNLHNGFSLLGRNLTIVLDNYMLVILLQQGILVYLLYAYLFRHAIGTSLQNENTRKIGVAIFFTLIYGISEAAINVSNSICILLVFLTFLGHEFCKKKTNETIEGEKDEKSIVSYQ